MPVKAKHVRLVALQGVLPDRTYLLSWLRGTRWIKGQLEIQAVFVPEASFRPANNVSCWIRASDFPFLILGSRWYRGIMVGKPLGLRRLTIPKTQNFRIHGVTTIGEEGKLNISPSYVLAEGGGNNPVLEFEGFDEGDEHGRPYRIYLPLTEVYRSSYFGIPVALPGILGGLINRAMRNPKFEAWDPDGTDWIDRVTREARITPARTLPQELAKRIARLIFSEEGRAALLSIHRWVQASFIAPEAGNEQKARRWLPIVSLPYERAIWDASVVELPVDNGGRRQLLVLHIESFDAPEPFNELEIIAPPSTESGEDGNDGGGHGGELLKPAPDDPVDDVEDGWDTQLEPVAVDDIIARDERVRRRLPRVVRPEAKERDAGSGGGNSSHETVFVDEVSTQASGPTNNGAAALVFTDENPAAEPDESLQHSIQAISRAMASIVSRHLKHGIEAHARFLPKDSMVYKFRVPASESEWAKTVAVPRQYVVAQVNVGGRIAYVIEPQRHSKHQPLPLGVAWLTGINSGARHAAFSTEHLHRIVQTVEAAAREGHSWVRKAAESKDFGVLPVIHAAGKPPSPEGIMRFSDRITAQLMAVIGDPVAISNPETSN